MWSNYLTIAIRIISRYKLFTLINIFGLSIGLASSIILLLYLDYEYSYDEHLSDSDRIYGVCFKGRDGKLYDRSAAPFTPILKSTFPDIESFARVSESNFNNKLIVNIDKNAYSESRCLLVDSSFFNIFECELISGSYSRFSRDKDVVVLSEKSALKYFNSIDVIGKSITIDGKHRLIIIGVIKDNPINSYLLFDVLIPISWAEVTFPYVDLEKWSSNHNFCSFVKMKKEIDIDEFQERIRTENLNLDDRFFAQLESIVFLPIRKMHVSNISGSINPRFDVSYLYLYLGIALVILFIACINFMNLLTAVYLIRVREIGMRKVMGADRKKIIIQFLSESVFLTLLALFFAIIIIESILPLLNSIQQSKMYFDYLNSKFIFFSLGVVFVVGIISGSYPAFFVSKLHPAIILKSGFKAKKTNILIKNVLVVLQFSISISLIIVAVMIYLQLHFIQSMDVGYNRENLIIIANYTNDSTNSVGELKRVFKQNPNVISVCANSFLPSTNRFYQSFKYEADGGGDSTSLISPIFVDEHFFETYQIEFLNGRNFSGQERELKSDYIINETAAKKFWNENPIGKKISIDGTANYGRIIGVVADINFASLHNEIKPCLYRADYPSYPYPYLTVRIPKVNSDLTIDYLEMKWKEVNSSYPFEFVYAEDNFNSTYKKDLNTGQLLSGFTVLSIIISCLGLYGLIAYSIRQRTKEISIRKVFGSSVSQITAVLTLNYVKWVVIANIIAWPVSYYILEQWLQNFFYRINMNWWVFVVAGIFTLIIALITVSYHAIKAANTDPAETLKFE